MEETVSHHAVEEISYAMPEYESSDVVIVEQYHEPTAEIPFSFEEEVMKTAEIPFDFEEVMKNDERLEDATSVSNSHY